MEASIGAANWSNCGSDFARLTGQAVLEDDLRHSIAVYNENRCAIRELYRARSRRPWLFPTSEVYLLLRAGNVLPPEDHTAFLREYQQLAPLESRSSRSRPEPGGTGRDVLRATSAGTVVTWSAPVAGSWMTTCCWDCAGSPATYRCQGDPMQALGRRLPHPKRRDRRALSAGR